MDDMDRTISPDSKVLPPMAGGAPLPSERLRAASRYMEAPEAEAAEQMAQAWDRMSSSERDALARNL